MNEDQEIEDENKVSNMSMNEDFEGILKRRMGRREACKVMGMGLMGLILRCESSSGVKGGDVLKGFKEVRHGLDDNLHVSEGYEVQILMRWGDPLFEGMGEFDMENQSGVLQAKRFGFNNDFISYFPIGGSSRWGLLVVNHEYTTSSLMFKGSPREYDLSEEEMEVTMMANGVSVIEIKRVEGSRRWEVLKGSGYNRRITPRTLMEITGPVRGVRRMVTGFSRDGVQTMGTFSNCSGGQTPWGTVLVCEENFNQYYCGGIEELTERIGYERIGIVGDGKDRGWGRYYPDWDLSQEPQSALHMGWVVEFDPYDVNSVPKKRTAMGRFKHEGCQVYLNVDNRVICYSGDDQRFEYVYKFVSEREYRAGDLDWNRDILAEGRLYAGQFKDDGRLIWRLLEYGYEGLDERNGFYSQSDVVIDTRKAADIMGATKMDRPEDIEVNPKTGTVFVCLTKNEKRKEVDGVNSRRENWYGQILELKAPGGDHTRSDFKWEHFILCGDPGDGSHGAKYYHRETTEDGWFVNPDNCTFDNRGRLWVTTDGAYKKHGFADGVWVCEVEGERRGLSRHFLRGPVGSESTGPCFTPDNETLFLSIQHPGEDGSYDEPTTRWPDFNIKYPARPSVIAITKRGGGVVGS